MAGLDRSPSIPMVWGFPPSSCTTGRARSSGHVQRLVDRCEPWISRGEGGTEAVDAVDWSERQRNERDARLLAVSVVLQVRNQADVYLGELDPSGKALLSVRQLARSNEREDYPRGWSP